MTVLSRRACGMSGTAAEWLFQLDHVTPYFDNVGVVRCISCFSRRAGCSDLASPCIMNFATLLRLSPTARMLESFRGWPARSIDGTRGAS